MNFYDFFLPFKRFEIMRHADEIHFRRQFIRGMSPVAVGEDTELAAADKRSQAFLQIGKIGWRTLRPIGNTLRDFRCFFRVGFQCAHDIHPIQRMQMIKMHDVILQILRAEHEITNQFRIRRHGDFQGVFDGSHRRQRVYGRAYAAGAFRKSPGVARVAAF